MKPGQIITFPRADKRYKPGKITKDTKGKFRGHPETVQLKVMDLPTLNPPIVISRELARHLGEKI